MDQRDGRNNYHYTGATKELGLPADEHLDDRVLCTQQPPSDITANMRRLTMQADNISGDRVTGGEGIMNELYPARQWAKSFPSVSSTDGRFDSLNSHDLSIKGKAHVIEPTRAISCFHLLPQYNIVTRCPSRSGSMKKTY